MSGASGVLFNIRLIQLREFLKTHCPALWKEHGARLRELNILTQYYRLKRIPFEYESNNEQVNLRLRTLVSIYKSTAVGLLVIFVGILLEIFGPADA